MGIGQNSFLISLPEYFIWNSLRFGLHKRKHMLKSGFFAFFIFFLGFVDK